MGNNSENDCGPDDLRIEFTDTLDLSSPDTKLKSQIVRAIKETFHKAPAFELFKGHFKGQIDAKTLDGIYSILRLHGFRTDETHLKLLKSIQVSKLSDDSIPTYHILMNEVYHKRGEYSLALEHAEAALQSTKVLSDNVLKLNCMITKGISLIHLDHPNVDKHHRETIQFANDNKITEGLAWAYHNWASYVLEKGHLNDALLLYEQETPLRRQEGPRNYAKHLGFLANLNETIDRSKAVNLLKELLTSNSVNPGCLLPNEIAESCYRVGVLLFQDPTKTAEALEYALRATELFSKELGEEARLAWAYGLVSICYTRLGKTEDALKYEGMKRKLLDVYGSDCEKFKLELTELIFSKNPSVSKIKILEQIASTSDNPQIVLCWNLAYSKYLLDNSEPDTVISFVENFTSNIASISGKLTADQKRDLSLLYFIEANAYSKNGDMENNVRCLQNAVLQNPYDWNLHWALCNNALAAGYYELAGIEAQLLLKNVPEMPGPYRVLAHVAVSNNKFDDAIAILMPVREKFIANQGLQEELKEIVQIKKQLLLRENSKYFKHITGVKALQPKALHESNSLAEYAKLDPFTKDCLNKILTYFHNLEKTPPNFLKDFNANMKGSLEEGDFRDELQRNLSFVYPGTEVEIAYGDGRADLVIKPLADPRKVVVVEFKIWGRNDYATVVEQLEHYLTSFQVYGVIFMINSNVAPIKEKYVDQAIFSSKSYLPGTFRKKPIDVSLLNLEHYYSRHKTAYGAEHEVFHFIFNCRPSRNKS